MIDFHSHIIPAIDDGARELKESLEMLEEASSAGFDGVISTSHYMENYYDGSKELHEKVGLEVAKNKIDILITVGKEAENIARVAKNNGIEHVYTFDNNKDATEKLKKIIAVDDVALIKASNSMNFKEIVESLLKH
jgi:tyrosine-protein phosphatase YwqE